MTHERSMLIALAVAAIAAQAQATSIQELRATAPEGAYVKVPSVMGRAVSGAAGPQLAAGGFSEPGVHQVVSPAFRSVEEARLALAERSSSLRSHGFVIIDSGIRFDGPDIRYFIDWVVSPRLGAGEARLIPAAETGGDHLLQHYPNNRNYDTREEAEREMNIRAARLRTAGFTIIDAQVIEHWNRDGSSYYGFNIDFILGR